MSFVFGWLKWVGFFNLLAKRFHITSWSPPIAAHLHCTSQWTSHCSSWSITLRLNHTASQSHCVSITLQLTINLIATHDQSHCSSWSWWITLKLSNHALTPYLSQLTHALRRRAKFQVPRLNILWPLLGNTRKKKTGYIRGAWRDPDLSDIFAQGALCFFPTSWSTSLKSVSFKIPSKTSL